MEIIITEKIVLDNDEIDTFEKFNCLLNEMINASLREDTKTHNLIKEALVTSKRLYNYLLEEN